MSDTSEATPDDVEAARLAALPPKFQEGSDTVLHKDYNEGQELPPVPFGEEHQSNHPQEEHACSKCGRVQTIGVPADPMAMVWECAFCGAKSTTPGVAAADLAKAQAAAVAAIAAVEMLSRGETPPVQVHASDSGTTSEVAG